MGAPLEIGQNRKELGEKLFVIGFALALATEAMVGAIGAILGSAWTGVLLCVVSVIALMLLTDAAYAGSRRARTLLIALVVLQVFIAGAALVITASHIAEIRKILPPTLHTALLNVSHMRNFAIDLGLPTVLLAACQLIGFFLSAVALCAPPTSVFLASRRGEEIAVADHLQPSGVAFALAEQESQAFATLGTLLCCAAWALIVAAILRLLVPVEQGTPSWFALVEGLVLLLVGLLMLVPAAAVRRLQQHGSDVAFLVDFLGRLRAFFLSQLFLGLVLFGVLAGRIYLLLLLR